MEKFKYISRRERLLYATGNVSGDLYTIDYPINMAGNSNVRCFIWGYLTGRKIVETAV